MLLGHRARRHDHLRRAQLVPLRLELGHDFSDEPAVGRVGLGHDVRALGARRHGDGGGAARAGLQTRGAAPPAAREPRAEGGAARGGQRGRRARLGRRDGSGRGADESHDSGFGWIARERMRAGRGGGH